MTSLSSTPLPHLLPQQPPLLIDTPTPALPGNQPPTTDTEQSDSTQTNPSTTDTASGSLAQTLADKQNLRSLGQKLNDMAQRLGVNATPQEILAALKSTPMDVQAAASYPVTPGHATTIEAFITSIGVAVPNSHFALTALADAVLSRAIEHPLGNLGGALSWPLPLSIAEQRTLLSAATQYVTLHPNPPSMGASLGPLDYLNSNQPLSGEAARDPAKVLETLLSTPRAQALGQAMQTQLNGIATDTSVNDYTLAALNLMLDPQSISTPHRNTVAGFDLAQSEHWGKPASAIFPTLSKHLSEQGHATAEMANVGAYLMLARKAPELLIKDIPSNVTYGSPAWVNLSIAAATIEAQTPGKVPNMSFAQVMNAAEDASLQDPAMTQQAQRAALRVWGVVNGALSQQEADRYSPDDVEKVRSAFNQQANERLEASTQIQAEMPSRKDIALAALKQRFGSDVPFEEKLLSVKNTKQPHIQPLYDPNRAPAGLHSLLDIAMSGLHQYEWESTDPRILRATQGESLQFDVNSTFNDQFTQAIDSRKKGIATAVKHMIAQLPLADRQNLEHGELEFYQHNTYKLGLGFTGRTLHSKNDNLLVKATGPSGETVYKIDLKQGRVTQVPTTVLTDQHERNASLVYPIERFTPTTSPEADFAQDKTVSSPPPTPSSYTSARTQSIADAFVEHLDIAGKDVVRQAKGATSYDQQMDTEWKLVSFLLDLIPLRSAIVNFQNGDYLDGATDLGMDIFGFVTAGAGAAAKVTKAGTSAVSAATKALRVAKILGTTVIGELNPFSGIGDLVQGGARLIDNGIEQVKHIGRHHNVLNVASAEYGPITQGTFKAADQTVEGSTILFDGQRYAYDPDKGKPYGAPIEAFNPLHRMMPPSPRARDSMRYDPLSRTNRPMQNRVQPRVPLPMDEYATSPHTGGALIEDHFTPDRIRFTREKFSLEKTAYFQDMAAGGMPPRPALPDITPAMSPNELIAKSLKETDVLVFGEDHLEVASLITMRDAMKTFKEGDVRALYVEGATLDAYGLIHDESLVEGIKSRVGGNTLYDELKKAAEEFDIEIMPLEHRYLTRHSDTKGYFSGLSTLPKSSAEYIALSKQRLEEVNYYGARQVMKNELGGKSVVWVGRSHMNTTEGVPGIAELTGGIGIGVYQKADIAQSVGLKAGKQRDTTARLSTTDDTAGDLQIQVKV
ncbi:MAG: hypothetical protein COB06_006870 [Pseudomonas sp.]|jgi:hypothetical protein|uniref:Uncharacterized protein n=7 Tax=Pseudomonas TaxID=286 RepID=A0ACA7P7Z5_9PSED|nr:hypothetical protein [Pseudomonas sp.]AHC36070.1 hypothetical protein U771_17755 [Pseudomonas sp. TKP]MBL1306955.1 hypothetical protein [Pseudomonas sp.]SDZ36184.1 hypothetical protein SAMN05444743_11390 [Pseudomonas sp. PDC86]